MAKSSSTETPMMQQHRAIKQKYPDAILLFRVGDFYETFGQDAVIASGILGITLTKRNNGAAASAELAGFPHHSLDTYLHKLVKAGYRVAVCDQLEDPKLTKGLVKRGVTDMVTPGTTVNDKLLEQKTNNFLAAIHQKDESNFGLAFLDISTGEFLLAEGNREYADKLIQSFNPSELIFQKQQQKSIKELFNFKGYTYTLDEWIFDYNYTQETLQKHFQTHSLKGFGVEDLKLGTIAAGAIFHYLKDTDHPNLQHIISMQRIDKNDFLWMDRFTIRNLELIQGAHEGNPTLLSVLDQTVSPMGARLLKRWIIFPLSEIGAIQRRLDTVEYLTKEKEVKEKLQESICAFGDIERLAAKIPFKKINPREVAQIAKGLREITQLKRNYSTINNALLSTWIEKLDDCPPIEKLISSNIIENPPASANKGSMIASGVNEELDQLRAISKNGKEYLTQLQIREAERTGIPSLKIGYNSVFGYYLEVTNSHKEKVAADWIRKQTLTNAERYITPELKEYEEKIMGAEEKILAIELRIYESLLTELQEYLLKLQINGNALANIDCLCCFATVAIQNNYKKPIIHEGTEWKVINGRHPVIEKYLNAGETYIGNDLVLNKEDQQLIILTGPNMSGKSALLRQTAIITIMAHIGGFVPADAAEISLTDKIFTRVGASDNLAGGESTFMVEMNETASIINNLTSKSLVLLDEIGRGTSTYDGISIAWSIAEYLHNCNERPLTLFATHYHELNDLENLLPRTKNYHITNKEVGGKIIFLRKLARGGTTHSFGIHVAKMAGMPNSLIERAEELLKQLENNHLGDKSKVSVLTEESPSKVQLSIFDTHTETFQEIRKLLESTDLNNLTPVEALLRLQEIKNHLK